MAVLDGLRARLIAAATDPEVRATAAGLLLRVRFAVGSEALDVLATGGEVKVAPASEVPDITVAAASEDWEVAMRETPPPDYHSFAAIQLRNPRFAVTGDPLVIAQARACLENLFEAMRPRAASAPRENLANIAGRYHRIRCGGQVADVFSEGAGRGPPILCLHTAGADSRQFHALMANREITEAWRVIAFDLPWHGRSLPPAGWDGGVYRLDQNAYRDWCVAFIEQAVCEPVVVMGCSMGAGISLVLAAERPDLVRAVVALEAPLRPRGRRNPYLTHAKVHGGWHSSAYVRGLLSPSSPAEDRRRAAWIYAQGGPGIYDGDLVFYSDEFDGEEVARRIDGRRTPVTLMIGHYDFSATVADAHALAGWIDGARVIEMPELGHFPMIENPAAFENYLRPVLARLRQQVFAGEAAR
jgi:pimeloyl-ACP methyl ester carboxylesterase